MKTNSLWMAGSAILATSALLGCMDVATDRGGEGYVENELAVSAVTTTTLQAENAAKSGPIFASSPWTGWTGTGYLDYQHASTDWVEWTLSIPTTGSYSIRFRYSNGGSTDRPLKIQLHNSDGTFTTIKSSFSFPPTGSFSTWKTVSFDMNLSSGTRKIRATAISSSGGNFDYLQWSGPNSSSTTGPSASALIALTSSCNKIGGNYATDDGGTSNVPVCKLNGAIWWKADMDIDCDGVRTTTCNENVDPWYQPQTSFQTSGGQELNSATLPYYVIPLPSSRFSYVNAGIKAGQVAAVVANGKVVYAVFGDEGPSNIIGEASVATAKALGINPDPANGGSDGPVYYFVLTGSSGVISPIEDHNKATSVGSGLANNLIKNN